MAGHLTRGENTSPELENYLKRWQVRLDTLALCTLWIVVLPLSTIGPGDDAVTVAIVLRVAVSVAFGIDAAHRARLAPRSWQYLRQHPLVLLAVPFPPLRIVFSVRLIASLFRRGHMRRFLLAAVLLLLNGAIIVFFTERRAPGANITTVGDAMWWAIVTVTTVGYGDLFPVTFLGRLAASGVMLIGLITLAVITAQVSASFMDQVRGRSADGSDRNDVAALNDRLERIESMLADATRSAERPGDEHRQDPNPHQ